MSKFEKDHFDKKNRFAYIRAIQHGYQKMAISKPESPFPTPIILGIHAIVFGAVPPSPEVY